MSSILKRIYLAYDIEQREGTRRKTRGVQVKRIFQGDFRFLSSGIEARRDEDVERHEKSTQVLFLQYSSPNVCTGIEEARYKDRSIRITDTIFDSSRRSPSTSRIETNHYFLFSFISRFFSLLFKTIPQICRDLGNQVNFYILNLKLQIEWKAFQCRSQLHK